MVAVHWDDCVKDGFTKFWKPKAGPDNSVAKAEHCIGLDRANSRILYGRHGNRYYRPYRNYYAAAPGGEAEWEEMVGAGFAEVSEETERGKTYKMTRRGLDRLGNILGIIIHDYK